MASHASRNLSALPAAAAGMQGCDEEMTSGGGKGRYQSDAPLFAGCATACSAGRSQEAGPPWHMAWRRGESRQMQCSRSVIHGAAKGSRYEGPCGTARQAGPTPDHDAKVRGIVTAACAWWPAGHWAGPPACPCHSLRFGSGACTCQAVACSSQAGRARPEASPHICCICTHGSQPAAGRSPHA